MCRGGPLRRRVQSLPGIVNQSGAPRLLTCSWRTAKAEVPTPPPPTPRGSASRHQSVFTLNTLTCEVLVVLTHFPRRFSFNSKWWILIPWWKYLVVFIARVPPLVNKVSSRSRIHLLCFKYHRPHFFCYCKKLFDLFELLKSHKLKHLGEQ